MNMLDDADFLLVAGWTANQHGFWLDQVRGEHARDDKLYTTEQAVHVELERRERARLFERAHRLVGIAREHLAQTQVLMGLASKRFFSGAKDPAWCEAVRTAVQAAPESPEIVALAEKRAKICAEIEAYEMGEDDEPASVPPELLQAHTDLDTLIEGLREAARGEARILVRKVEPVESKLVLGFVSRPGRHGMEEVTHHTYPTNPTGRTLRALRHRLGVPISYVARVLSVSPVIISGLDRGSHTTDDNGWVDVVVAVLAIALLCENDKDPGFGWTP